MIPSDIFNAYPGQMFVTRNIANIVPPLDEREGYHGTMATIEYAIKVLGVEMIVVMGHESCGGIQAALTVWAMTRRLAMSEMGFAA